MIFEAFFWVALVSAIRAIAKSYYRRRDVLYGPYIRHRLRVMRPLDLAGSEWRHRLRPSEPSRIVTSALVTASPYRFSLGAARPTDITERKRQVRKVPDLRFLFRDELAD
jgi:hypothetical protein